MRTYLLDTNVISHIMRGDSLVIRERIAELPAHALFVSAISEAELTYGVLRRGNPVKLADSLEVFLHAVTVLPWHRNAAIAYAQLRCRLQKHGICLSPIDMLVAAHAKAAGAVLVSRDKSFSRLDGDPAVEDWQD